MLKLFGYLLKQGVATSGDYCAPLAEGVIGLPKFTDEVCAGTSCGACQTECPTQAINVTESDGKPDVTLDLGSCIGCAVCVRTCPTGTIANDNRTKVASDTRLDLIVSSTSKRTTSSNTTPQGIFERSIAARVVSTGCSACDLEIGACNNAIFDMERFGIHIVASPRFADVLLVTGPVPKAMHSALKSCYEAMAEPRIVIAVGTCAISGGVHKNGYTEANGVDKILPVDAYIPGCPPHPWSIIDGIRNVMKRK
ncbi:MAG: NADH-quinone oxidoreductase subunit NuoB [Candidatus Melainabacteria bacterium]|nr:NADH-quinone oxidoreductase subunit NuoB [Candidatus Melainabacteria bacterium]